MQNLKALISEGHDDIIKKYDEKLVHLRGKSIDTNTISKVLEFNKYLKRAQPLLTVNRNLHSLTDSFWWDFRR